MNTNTITLHNLILSFCCYSLWQNELLNTKYLHSKGKKFVEFMYTEIFMMKLTLLAIYEYMHEDLLE